MRAVLSEKHLEVLMSLYSQRDLPESTRYAVRLRVIYGYTYEFAEFRSGVTRKTISAAVAKLVRAHNRLLVAYV